MDDTTTIPPLAERTASRIAWMDEQVAAGRTVYVCTYLRRQKWTPKQVAEFRALGIAPWKAGKSGSLWIYEGSTKGRPCYSCADYCELQAS